MFKCKRAKRIGNGGRDQLGPDDDKYEYKIVEDKPKLTSNTPSMSYPSQAIDPFSFLITDRGIVSEQGVR